MRRLARVLVLAVLVALARPARADELLVFAAASLTDVLRELGADFARASGAGIAYNFGGSNALARQIEAGAPADVFFSADEACMAALVRAGLVDAAARRDVLSNTLVVVVPAAAPASIAAPADLRAVKTLALADPEAVPAGVYAKQYLERIGLWSALEPKVVPTLDVRAALAAVEAARAEAAIVYATDAAVSRRVRVAYRVPREAGPRIVYPLAPLRRARHAATGAFVRFLTSADATPVYERHGFVVLPAG